MKLFDWPAWIYLLQAFLFGAGALALRSKGGSAVLILGAIALVSLGIGIMRVIQERSENA